IDQPINGFMFFTSSGVCMAVSRMDPIVPATPLAGATALVTGAGQGIGRGIALALAAAGAAVAVVGRTAETIGATAVEITDRGGRAVSYVCDVTDGAAVEETVAAVVQESGGRYTPGNNAQSAATGPLLGLGEDEYGGAIVSGPT